jgi:membrane protein
MGFLRRIGELLGETFRALRGRDIALHAAAVTFYAGIALVPSVLVAVWLAGQLVGDARIRELGRSLAEALPGQLGAPHIAEATIAAGLQLSSASLIVVLLPATFYGEGLRRAFVSLTTTPDRLIGWRGRIAVLFLSLPLRLGVPFGGFTEVGGMVAIGLWLYLLHVLVLVGFLLTLRIDARGGVPWRRPNDVRRSPATPPDAPILSGQVVVPRSTTPRRPAH